MNNPYVFDRDVHETNALRRELRSRRFQHAHVRLRVRRDDHGAELNKLSRLIGAERGRQWPDLWRIQILTYAPLSYDEFQLHALGNHVSSIPMRFETDVRFYERLFQCYANLRYLNIHFCQFQHPVATTHVPPDVKFPVSLTCLEISICTHVPDPLPEVLAKFMSIIPSCIKRRKLRTSIMYANIDYDRFNELDFAGRHLRVVNLPSIRRLTCDSFMRYPLSYPMLQHLTTYSHRGLVQPPVVTIPSLKLMGIMDEDECIEVIQKLPSLRSLRIPIPMTERILESARSTQDLLYLATTHKPPGISRLHPENHVVSHLVYRRAWAICSLLIAFVRAQPGNTFRDSILTLLRLIPLPQNMLTFWTREKSSAFMLTRAFTNRITKKRKASYIYI